RQRRVRQKYPISMWSFRIYRLLGNPRRGFLDFAKGKTKQFNHHEKTINKRLSCLRWGRPYNLIVFDYRRDMACHVSKLPQTHSRNCNLFGGKPPKIVPKKETQKEFK
ncbi:MAG: hypothetical protein R3Y27_06555, partial [Clostridia bacterium]